MRLMTSDMPVVVPVTPNSNCRRAPTPSLNEDAPPEFTQS